MQQFDEKVREFTGKVLDHVKWRRAHTGISKELTAHIEDQAANYQNEGVNAEAAYEKAIIEMGDPETLGVAFHRAHKPAIHWMMFFLTGIVLLVGFLVQYRLIAQSGNGNGAIGSYLVTFGAGLGLLIITYIWGYPVIVKYAYVLSGGILLFLLLGYYAFAPVNGSYPHVYYLCLLFVPVFASILARQKGYGYGRLLLCLLVYFAAAGLVIGGPSMTGLLILTITALSLMTAFVIKGWFRVRKMYGLLLLYIPVALLFFLVLADSHRFARFRNLFFPGEDPFGAGYVTLTVRDLIQGAAWIGPGSNQYDMPVETLLGDWHTNHLLTYFATKFGMLAFVCIVLLFVAFTVQMVRICLRHHGSLGFALSLAVVLSLGTQTGLYILMNLGWFFPLSLTLPFFSFGKAATCTSMILIGIFLSTYRYKNLCVEEKKVQGVKSEPFLSLKDGAITIRLK